MLLSGCFLLRADTKGSIPNYWTLLSRVLKWDRMTGHYFELCILFSQFTQYLQLFCVHCLYMSVRSDKHERNVECFDCVCLEIMTESFNFQNTKLCISEIIYIQSVLLKALLPVCMKYTARGESRVANIVEVKPSAIFVHLYYICHETPTKS